MRVSCVASAARRIRNIDLKFSVTRARWKRGLAEDSIRDRLLNPRVTRIGSEMTSVHAHSHDKSGDLRTFPEIVGDNDEGRSRRPELVRTRDE